MIGLLMYLTNSRPDLCFVVTTLIQYMIESIHVHLIATNHVMRYLKGTVDYGLLYVVDCEYRLMGYSDLDWVDNVTDRKSTSICCFSLGSAVISWLGKKQTNMSLSTVEVEYIVACSTCSEAVWPRKLLVGLFDLELDVTCICCDNQSCIKLLENPVFHDKSKHIKIKYEYILDIVEKAAVKLQYVATDE